MNKYFLLCSFTNAKKQSRSSHLKIFKLQQLANHQNYTHNLNFFVYKGWKATTSTSWSLWWVTNVIDNGDHGWKHESHQITYMHEHGERLMNNWINVPPTIFKGINFQTFADCTLALERNSLFPSCRMTQHLTCIFSLLENKINSALNNVILIRF